MTAPLARHRVFRVIEARGHGFWPFRPFEGATAGVVGLLGWQLHLFLGLALAGCVLAVLVGHRRWDFDRSDYLLAMVQRPRTRIVPLSLATPVVGRGVGR